MTSLQFARRAGKEIMGMTHNPYTAPQSNVASTHAEEYGEIKIFSAHGRIGRLRYMGYSFGLMLLVGAFMAGVTAAAGPTAGIVAFSIGWLLIIVINFMLSIPRAHDFNTTGWISILCMVPVVNFLFWFIPGTAGENDYGKKTPPNTAGTIVLAAIFPFFFVTGILAAIALPAYSDYVKRAKAASVQPAR